LEVARHRSGEVLLCCITRHPLQGGVRGPRGSRELAEAGTSGCGAERRGGKRRGLKDLEHIASDVHTDTGAPGCTTSFAFPGRHQAIRKCSRQAPGRHPGNTSPLVHRGAPLRLSRQAPGPSGPRPLAYISISSCFGRGRRHRTARAVMPVKIWPPPATPFPGKALFVF
jgi:hypothetical protein